MPAEHTVSEIRQIALAVSDIGNVLPFYRDILGLKFLFSPSPNLAFLEAGGVRLMLTTPQGVGAVGHNSILYFNVKNIEAAHAAMLGRGAMNERGPQITARMPDHEVWTAFFRDPDGNIVALMEEKPTARQ